MTRYFARVSSGNVFLSSSDEHHLLVVLRARKGTEIEVVDHGSLYLAEITMLKPLIIAVKRQLETATRDYRLTLIYSLPKGEKLDFVVQKATELGVDHIILTITKRSIVKWQDADISRKLARYEAIIKEAAEQSRRTRMPELSFAPSLSEVFTFDFGLKLIASELEAGKPPLNVPISQNQDLAILVGPEGGFEPTELDTAIKAGYLPVSLGRHILRSETAAIAAMALIGYIKEHATI